jgi:hypothetical protein
MEDNKDINFTTTNAGLHIYDKLWDRHELDNIFNSTVPKHSGKEYSKIAHNLVNRLLVDANSMTALAEKDKEEYFLAKNAQLHRTSYGRNLVKPNDKQRNRILLKLNNKLITKEEIHKHTIMIYDPTAIEAAGEEYENTKWVWDSCQGKMVMGYELNKLLLKTKKKVTPLGYNVNGDSNPIKMFKQGRIQVGINKVVFDADSKFGGMKFYKELGEEEFLFYTKTVIDWKFNYGFDMNIKQLRKRFMYLLKRNGVLSRTVYKEDMKLRLIFVLGDKRVILTNDFRCSPIEAYNYYVDRWKIETSFKEEKQNLGLDNLPTWKFEGVKTHFLLCILAYVLSQFIVSKVKVADGIKLIKRRIVKIFAVVIKAIKSIELEFDVRYRFRYVFDLEFG